MSDPVNVETLRAQMADARRAIDDADNEMIRTLDGEPMNRDAMNEALDILEATLNALGPLLDEVERYRKGLQTAVDALTFYAGCFRAMGAPDTATGAERDAAQALTALTGPTPE